MIRCWIKRMLLSALALMMLFPLCVSAQSVTDEGMAEDISRRETVTQNQGFGSLWALFDKKEQAPGVYLNGSWLTLSNEQGIGSVYCIFNADYPSVTLIDNAAGREETVQTHNMAHWFLNLTDVFGYAPQTVTLCFEAGEVPLNELYVFTPGQVPEWVQTWGLPLDQDTDLLLLSAHGDDEQLFFAGMLPYYAGELGYRVQVAYMTDHRAKTPIRVHEMLNGLWAVGVRTYPVFGTFPDFLSNSLQGGYEQYRNNGITEEDVLGFVVEQLRRFCPLVAVTHDVKGEYGHGMHMMLADCLMKAVEVCGDADVFPESASKYGVWEVPKAYIHMYPENTIKMDWDKPLSSFNGKTAFEVTRDLGFACHVSQFRDFIWYYSGVKTAAEVPQYNPCDYGLYHSRVGADVQKNDFFENLITREQLDHYPVPEPVPNQLPQDSQVSFLEPEEEAALPEISESVQADEIETAEKSPVFLVIAAGIAVISLALLLILIRKKYFFIF